MSEPVESRRALWLLGAAAAADLALTAAGHEGPDRPKRRAESAR